MTAARHTPGPWLYRPKEYDDWGFVRNAAGMLIARATIQTLSYDVLAKHRADGTDPVEANASLIAAAPDLLASLLTMLAYAKAYKQDFGNGMIQVGNELAATRIAEADAAIAKAEGRPS